MFSLPRDAGHLGNSFRPSQVPNDNLLAVVEVLHHLMRMTMLILMMSILVKVKEQLGFYKQ